MIVRSAGAAIREPVMLLGPRRDALSGVSTHLSVLFSSRLAQEFALIHFEVGSEGRNEGSIARLLRLISSPFRLATAIVGQRAVVVHLNTALTPRAYWRDLAYMIVARLCGARVLYQIHGGPVPQAFCRGHRLLAVFLRMTLRLPSAIVALSRIERDAFRRFLGSMEVEAIPNAIDCTPYAALVRVRSKPEAPLRLVYIGRLVREKGLYELLEGLRLVHAQGVAAELVIAGGGPEAERLRDSVAASGLERVSFAGAVRGADKIAMLGRADVFVLATYHAEGLPYAVLESMAAGVPVITTRVGALPELVVDGLNGLLIEPRDPAAIAAAIRRLAGDRERLARMSDASRTTIAAGYTVARLGAQFCRLYAQLCARRTRLHVARR